MARQAPSDPEGSGEGEPGRLGQGGPATARMTTPDDAKTPAARLARAAYDQAVERFSFRRFFIAQVAFVTVLVVGTVGFVLLTDEDWSSSFYRSVVTTTLTGLDSPPRRRRPPSSSPSSCCWRAWQSSSTLRARSSS